MTGGTDRAGLGRPGLDHMRQMRRMTFEAIDLGHIRDMPFVTIETLLRRAMVTDVTLAAVERRMLVRILLMQSLLVVVTGNTDRLHLAQLAEIHL